MRAPSHGRRSRRTARAEFLANQQPREWRLLPNGFDVTDTRDQRGWRAYTASIDTARAAFGLATSTAVAA